LLGLAAVPWLLGAARAAPRVQEVENDTCLACHNQPGLSTNLSSGEVLSLYVSPQVFDGSVHGHEGLNCTDCHTSITGFPHPAFEAQTRREFSLELYTACRACHATQYALTQDSVHERARAAGQEQAAVCTDCHGSHGVQRMTDPDSGDLLAAARLRIPQTCARCHSTIFDKYLTSVHGSALIGQGNPDVPTCIDCHGVHNIEDPTTAAFRLASPQLCARCHSDPARMDKYGLSTQVLQTYVADFHGTTVTIFEKLSPDAETNKPVCFDCHGVHDIARTDDPQRGLKIRENLLARCQRCHPNATINFPDAWLSHYIPSAQKTPVVFAVDLFYKLFIPATLGGMAVLVGLDATWQVRRRRKPPARPREGEKLAPSEVQGSVLEGPAPTGTTPAGPSEVEVIEVEGPAPSEAIPPGPSDVERGEGEAPAPSEAIPPGPSEVEGGEGEAPAPRGTRPAGPSDVEGSAAEGDDA
jgi:hypothetical protein